MNRVNCKVVLYEGDWQRKLSRDSVALLLRRAFPEDGECSLVVLDFVEPDEDVAFEIDVVVTTDWSDQENVSDTIIREVLRRFEPEYESMVEVDAWESDNAS